MKIPTGIIAITTLAVLAAVITTLAMSTFIAQAQEERGAVPNLQLSSTSPGELTIQWDTPIPAPADYRLIWAEESLDFLSYSASNEANRGSEYPAAQDTSITLTDLTKGSTFKIQIRTRYESGGGNDFYKLYATAKPNEDDNRHPRWAIDNSGVTKDSDAIPPDWNAMRSGDIMTNTIVLPQFRIYAGVAE